LLFVPFFSDDDDPKRDDASAPLLGTVIITKVPFQEEVVVVKSPKVPPKKSTHVRASKHLKKTVAVGNSLEANRPAASSSDVSIASSSRFFIA
jgi:hypothetical protein